MSLALVALAVINIIVNVGNGMYSRDEWVKIVFDAIAGHREPGHCLDGGTQHEAISKLP